MFHQLKITSCAFIVALVPFLFLPLPTLAQMPHPLTPMASSCKGWECTIEGQVCFEGLPGASDASYVCTDNKWEEFEPEFCLHVIQGPPLVECMHRAESYMTGCVDDQLSRSKGLCTEATVECLTEDWRAKLFKAATKPRAGRGWGSAHHKCKSKWKKKIRCANGGLMC